MLSEEDYQGFTSLYTDYSEFEIRTRFTVRQKPLVRQLVVEFGGSDFVNTLDVDLLVPQDEKTTWVRRFQYKSVLDKKSASSLRYYKTQIHSKSIRIEDISFRLALSEEIPTKDGSDSRTIYTSRSKIRGTWISDNWKLDITLASTERDIPISKIQSSRDRLFAGVSAETETAFFDHPAWAMSRRWVEVEVEYIGNSFSRDIMAEGVLKVVKIMISIKSKEIILNKIDKILNPNGRRRQASRFGYLSLVKRPIAMTRTEFAQNAREIQQYYITPKADGIHALIGMTSDRLYIFSGNNELEVKMIEGGPLSLRVFEAEIIEIGDKTEIHVFDILIHSEKKVELDLTGRIALMAKVIPDQFNVKQYVRGIDNIKKLKPIYPVDGYILVSDSQYSKLIVYKWKPPSENTMDFLLLKIDIKVPPFISPGKTTYLLLSGLSKDLYNAWGFRKRIHRLISPYLSTTGSYLMAPFMPSRFPDSYIWFNTRSDLDGKIVELSYTYPAKKFKFKGIRKDKGLPNNFKTVEAVLENIVNPLTLEILTDPKSADNASTYFQVYDSQLHKKTRYFNTAVKYELITRILIDAPNKKVWDAAAGKGQDMFKVSKAGCTFLWMTDINQDGLSEAISRKYSLNRDNSPNGMNVLVSQIDMGVKNAYLDAFSTMREADNFGTVMINFAIHYLTKTEKMIHNCLKSCSESMVKGGLLLITSFDGDKIHKLLKDGDYLVVTSKGVPKFGVKQKYNDGPLNDYGQAIDVLLPFSGNKYYTEYLVNYTAMIVTAKKVGLMVHTSGYFNEFTNGNYSSLSTAEKDYVSYLRYIVFRKK